MKIKMTVRMTRDLSVHIHELTTSFQTATMKQFIRNHFDGGDNTQSLLEELQAKEKEIGNNQNPV